MPYFFLLPFASPTTDGGLACAKNDRARPALPAGPSASNYGLLADLHAALLKRIMQAEMTQHLGHESVLTESSQLDIRVPRGRAGTF